MTGDSEEDKEQGAGSKKEETEQGAWSKGENFSPLPPVPRPLLLLHPAPRPPASPDSSLLS